MRRSLGRRLPRLCLARRGAGGRQGGRGDAGVDGAQRQEPHDQHRRRAAADAVDRRLVFIDASAGMTGIDCVGEQRPRVRQARRQRAHVVCARALGCMQQPAVSREHGERGGHPVQQAMNALMDGKVGPCGLGCRHQHGRRLRADHNARAGAGERRGERGGEAAQPLEARRRSGRQRCSEPRDLGGHRVGLIETPRGERRSAAGCKQCRAHRVRP